MPGSNLVVDFPLYGESMSAKSFDIIFEVSKLNLVACSTENSENSDDRSVRKSLNITEYVPVPSSEHVAEIVGRQGCKIKALRGKTNTYIKTPVRGEDPVFVITGRKEDVHNAKMEIISAAEHFSQIRACRKQNNTNPVNPSTTPGQVTIQVRVPYRVVGLVVGPKGATIKRIQQQTRTYIVTPSRDKEPVFEITGTAEQVDLARKEIELHIQNRTGGLEGISDSETDAKPNFDQTPEYVSQNGTHEETNGVFESSHMNKGCELDEGIDSPTIDTYNGWWSQSDLTDSSKPKTTLCSQSNEAPSMLSNRSHSVSSADLLSKYCAPHDDCLLRPQVRRMYSDPVVAFPLNVEYATSDFFFPCLNSCAMGARYGELTASPSESFGSVSSSQENVLTLQDTVHW